MNIQQGQNAQERNKQNADNAVTNKLRDKRIMEAREAMTAFEELLNIEEISAQEFFDSRAVIKNSQSRFHQRFSARVFVFLHNDFPDEISERRDNQNSHHRKNRAPSNNHLQTALGKSDRIANKHNNHCQNRGTREGQNQVDPEQGNCRIVQNDFSLRKLRVKLDAQNRRHDRKRQIQAVLMAAEEEGSQLIAIRVVDRKRIFELVETKNQRISAKAAFG